METAPPLWAPAPLLIYLCNKSEPPFPAWIYVHCVLFFRRAPLWRVWLHLLTDFLVGTKELLLGPSKIIFFQVEQAPIPQPLLKGKVLQPLSILVTLHWTCSIYQHLSCTGGPKTECAILDVVYQVRSKGDNPFPHLLAALLLVHLGMPSAFVAWTMCCLLSPRTHRSFSAEPLPISP